MEDGTPRRCARCLCSSSVRCPEARRWQGLEDGGWPWRCISNECCSWYHSRCVCFHTERTQDWSFLCKPLFSPKKPLGGGLGGNEVGSALLTVRPMPRSGRAPRSRVRAGSFRAFVLGSTPWKHHSHHGFRWNTCRFCCFQVACALDLAIPRAGGSAYSWSVGVWRFG